jgi:hypothetical protein
VGTASGANNKSKRSGQRERTQKLPRPQAAATMAAAPDAYRSRTTIACTSPTEKAERHRDIARFYAWERRQRRGFVPRTTLIIIVRLREIERLFAARYGRTPPDDDAGRDDLLIATHTIAGPMPMATLLDA